MSEPKPEGTRTDSQAATLPSYQPTTGGTGDAGANARRTANPTISNDPTSTGSPTYVPRSTASYSPAPAGGGLRPTRAVTSATTGATASTTAPAVAESLPAAPARSAEPVSVPKAARTSAAPGRVRRTRKARLRIARVDPWSVMKTALLFGIAGGIILVVATYVVMSVIESTGVYQAINQVVGSMLSSPTDTTPFSIEAYINTRRVTGLAALIGAVDVVIFTALATVFSFLYNLSATMLGGLEITLAED